jgi:hypothetical protein
VRLALALVTLVHLGACGDPETTPGCPASPCAIHIEGYEPEEEDVISVGSRAGTGVAAVLRGTDRLILPLRTADGEPLARAPDLDLAFAIPGAGKNVTVSWLGRAHPAGRPDGIEPLDLGARRLTISGTPGPDRLAADVSGTLVVEAGAGNDVLVLAAASVEVSAGEGHDAVTVRDRGAFHVVDGGPGRDRLVAGGASVTLVGGDGEDCLLPLAADAPLLVDGGAGDDRSPRALGGAVERGGLAGTSEAFVWCGPLAAPSPDDDAVVWPDPQARAIEDGVLAAIVSRRSVDPSCRDGTWRPAPARVEGFAARRLKGVARAHAASVNGYPGPQSNAWAGGAFVAGHLIPDGSQAHVDRDGDWYDQRALRAGDPVTLADGGVAEATQRCPVSDPRCTDGAAGVIERVVQEFLESPRHCDLLMGRAESATGVVIAVGAHRQDRSLTGAELEPPGWFVDVLVEDDLGADGDRP